MMPLLFKNVTGGTGSLSSTMGQFSYWFYQDNLAAAGYTILITDSVGCTKQL